MNLLFICNQGENRSRTAAEIFSKKYETSYAGFYSLNRSLLLKESMLKKADAIFVMEQNHINELINNYPYYYLNKRIINLEIPDIYCYNQEELIIIIKKSVNFKLKEIEKLIEHV
jgi:predicted protein tyrosine phosphatase